MHEARNTKLITSWGGTPKVIVRKSTFWYDSIHGSTKKMPAMQSKAKDRSHYSGSSIHTHLVYTYRKLPGPLDPPWSSRPSRNMTALSYSCTTLKQTQREKGIVTRTRAHEIIVRSSPQSPTPLSDSSAVTRNRTTLVISFLSLSTSCSGLEGKQKGKKNNVTKRAAEPFS